MVLVSGVVGFSWSLVVCIVVGDDGGLGWKRTPNHNSQIGFLLLSFEEGRYISGVQQRMYIYGVLSVRLILKFHQ